MIIYASFKILTNHSLPHIFLLISKYVAQWQGKSQGINVLCQRQLNSLSQRTRAECLSQKIYLHSHIEIDLREQNFYLINTYITYLDESMTITRGVSVSQRKKQDDLDQRKFHSDILPNVITYIHNSLHDREKPGMMANGNSMTFFKTSVVPSWFLHHHRIHKNRFDEFKMIDYEAISKRNCF